MTSCIPGEKLCIQRPKGVKDEMLHMYIVVLEELGVKIMFTPVEVDVLKYLKMAPSQSQPNRWAFIRGFEVLCDTLDLEPFIGVFFHFYGTKGEDKLSWVSISAQPAKKLSPPYASNFKKDWREMFVRVQGPNSVWKMLWG